MKNVILKLRIIIPLILVIVLIGFFAIYITGKDHALVFPLIRISYLLAILSIVLAERLRFSLIFFMVAMVIPPLEYYLIGPENFSAMGVPIEAGKENFFTYFGNVVGAFFAYILPGALFIYKLSKKEF